jgi:glycosyltransferase involved in cell wall biosynthesis
MEEGGKRLHQPHKECDRLVSIITVVYNEVNTVRDTIQSVVRTHSDEREYLIIDGGSNDGTIDVIKSYDDSVDYWISEPDKGIYDAINKGISLSKGDYLLVVNAGDRLIHLPLEDLRVARALHADVVLFDVLFSNGKIFRSQIDYRSRFGNTVHHQGAFYSRKMNIKYDLAFKVFADFDVNQKLLIQKKKFLKFDKVISSHSLDGISNEKQYRGEYFSVIRKNFGLFWVLAGSLYLWQGELRSEFRRLCHII